MVLQGHGAGAADKEGLYENSNLERQGCSPFYQELIEDPYVDLVSGHDSWFSTAGHIIKLQKKKYAWVDFWLRAFNLISFPHHELYILSQTVLRQNEYWFHSK